MKNLFCRLTMIVFLCLPAAQGGAQQSIEIIELQNRPAAEIIPLIEPLLGPDDVVTGTGFRLIVRVAPATLSQLREVLSAFDAVPRNLTVSVRRGGVETAREREVRLQGRIGDVTVGDGSGSRIIYRQTNDRDSGVQTLRVLEGQTAFIHAGESIPVLRHGGIVLPGAVIGPEIDYRDLERGFLVRPWATPDGRVRIDIQQVDERESRSGGGRIDFQRVDTVLSGGIGEWIRIAGVEHRRDSTERRVLGTRRDQGAGETEIHVRVDWAD